MLIAQITDLHIAPPGEKTLGHVPMDENLKACIAQINAQTPRPDVVVVSGDITDLADAASARYAREMLDKLEMPYYVIPGNHDSREVILAGFGPDHCPTEMPGFITYVIDDYDIRLIGLDSTIPGAAGGEMCASRLTWLARRLEEKPDKPTFIFVHHPPLKCGVLESDADGFIGSDAFGDIIRRHANILRVASGHIHLGTSASWNGTCASTAPSIGIRLAMDLTQTHESSFFIDDPAFQLHLFTDQKNLITHTQYLGNAAGPYAFEFRERE